MTSLGQRLRPCGPIVDAAATERTREAVLEKSAAKEIKAFEAKRKAEQPWLFT